MRGHLIKDLKLLKNQRKFYLIVLLLAVLMLMSGSKGYGNFVTSYMTFLMSVYSFTTFSYDEYDNGMSFLMTLPASRRAYVQAKYLISGLTIFGGWLTAVILRFAFVSTRFSLEEWMEDAGADPIYLLIAWIFIACSIPCLIKFGVEKGRTGAMLVIAVVIVATYLLSKTGIGKPYVQLLGELLQDGRFFMGILTVACILIVGSSYLCSLKFIEEKEF